jgi:hypothetical protein
MEFCVCMYVFMYVCMYLRVCALCSCSHVDCGDCVLARKDRGGLALTHLLPKRDRRMESSGQENDESNTGGNSRPRKE